MTSEDVVKKGKEILASKGLVESGLCANGDLVEPRIPGLGAAGASQTFTRNRSALSKYYIECKLLGDNFVPDINTNFFNNSLSMPILVAPMSGIKTNLMDTIDEKEFLKSILEVCRDLGTVGMCGDSFDTSNNYVVPGLIANIGGVGVCKPREFEALKERINELKNANPYAIGIDLDGIAGMLLETGQVTRKSRDELKKIRNLFSGPMFLKGIMSIDDAVIAHESGFDGIVVSNHGGRSIDYGLGTADVLPKIAKKLKGKIKILVDGGVKNGYDVFLYLALGADAVLVGRTALYGVIGGGQDGLRLVLTKMASDLKRAMIFSGTKNLADITSDHLGKYE